MKIFSWKMLFSALISISISLLLLELTVQAEQKTAKEFPSLVAQFESTIIQKGPKDTTQTGSWYFLRSPGRAELKDVQGYGGELWKKEADGQIYYTRLFHKHKQAIEYFPGDLLALETKVDWIKINQMIEDELIQGKLKHLGQVTHEGRQGERYEGEMDGVKIELIWLKDKRLPLKYAQYHWDKSITLKLKQIWTGDEAPVQHTDVKDYSRNDFSDIGDMEADPFMKHLAQQSLGHHHGH